MKRRRNGDSMEELTLSVIRRQQINRAVGEPGPKCRRALFLRWRRGLRIATSGWVIPGLE